MRGLPISTFFGSHALTALSLQLFQSVEIFHPDTGDLTNTLIIGRVKTIHVRNDVVAERYIQAVGEVTKTVDAAKYQVVSRMGDVTYAAIGPMLRLSRPVWMKDQETIEETLKRNGVAQPKAAL